MTDIYLHCPTLEGPSLTLRPLLHSDAQGLLAIYGDAANLPFFNSDNCHGDTFHYTTLDRMEEAVRFWQYAYEVRAFVRWTLEVGGRIAGMVECFRREAEDAFTDCALLRIDLGRADDTADVHDELLSLLLPHLQAWFGCCRAATKAPAIAQARQTALRAHGFRPSSKSLIGHDGTRYGDYWLLEY